MNIIFAGTPSFAVPALQQCHEHFTVKTVLTQPDKPSGRGRKLSASPVKEFSLAANLNVYQPACLKDEASISTLSSQPIDLMVVIAYGLIIPKAILEIPKHGCVCFHLSLLPRWRGAAPGPRAILSGDTLSGVTLFAMDSGIDSGEVIAYEALNVSRTETTASLYSRLGDLAATMVGNTLPKYVDGQYRLQQQDEEAMTYAAKINKNEALINWELSAIQIERMVRAFNPWPIAYTLVGDQRLRIWSAEVINQLTDSAPGMIIGIDKKGIDVACGAGILKIKELQWAGGKVQAISDVLNANNNPLSIGTIFHLPVSDVE